MRRLYAIFIIINILAAVSIYSVKALSENQSEAIQSLLNEASSQSATPALSLSIVDGDDTFYFSSGYADQEKGIPATKNTLYELASVSKAFTGAGILLLEEQGFLSMTDSIQKYLPWLSFEYEGRPIDMQNLTLNHFLHHSSGLTNEKHFQDIPQGNSQDMLFKTVKMLENAELAFQPGQQYQYGTINYDVLGLVIEIVSAKHYERFMTDEVFHPLGLYHTYLYEAEALETGQLAQGYRTSFFTRSSYDAPAYAGNKPAGYIISSSAEMARWVKIQMGMVEDIPDIYKRVIKKSHLGNQSVAADNGMYYGAGWLVDPDKSMIEHDGVNPSFSTQVVLFPEKKRAISLLTNSANTNNSQLVESINEILEGKLVQSYQISALQISDIILSSLTIVFTLLAFLFLILGLIRKSTNKISFIKKNKIVVPILFVLTFALIVLSLIYPLFIGYNWATLLVWQPYSLVTALISFSVLSTSITCYIWNVSKNSNSNK